MTNFTGFWGPEHSGQNSKLGSLTFDILQLVLYMGWSNLTSTFFQNHFLFCMVMGNKVERAVFMNTWSQYLGMLMSLLDMQIP